MDQTLHLQNLQPKPSQRVSRSQTTAMVSRMAVLFATIGVAITGCQTGMMARNNELPVPAAQLEPSEFQTVRYQGPGGSGSKNTPAAGGLRRPQRDEVHAPDPWETLAPGANGEEVNQANVIIDVVIKGNQSLPSHQILGMIQSRVGRYFDEDKLKTNFNATLIKCGDCQKLIESTGRISIAVKRVLSSRSILLNAM